MDESLAPTDAPDPITGHPVRQWTHSADRNQHLYFTSPSVSDDDRWLFLLRDTQGSPNLWVIDRPAARACQLSHNTAGQRRAYCFPAGNENGLSKASACLDPARALAYYEQGSAIWRVSPGEVAEKLADLPGGWWGAFNVASPDGRHLAVPITNPEAFHESSTDQTSQMKAVGQAVRAGRVRSRILRIDTTSGASETWCEVPFWVTHIQFDPAGSGRAVFNAEGHWTHQTKAHPRVWMLDPDGAYQPLYEQPAHEIVGHENWLPDGSGIVYHGHLHDGDNPYGTPFLAARRPDGALLYQHECPEHRGYGHYITTADPRKILTDAGSGQLLREMTVTTDEITETILGQHASELIPGDQDTHAHPIATPRGVLFTANRNHRCDVFEIRLPGAGFVPGTRQ